MQRPPRIVQLVFEPIDLFAQAVAFLLMPVPLPFQFASQPLGFALAAFEFGDQYVARRGAYRYRCLSQGPGARLRPT